MNEIPRSRILREKEKDSQKSIQEKEIIIVPLESSHIKQICEIEKDSFSDPWSEQMISDLADNPLAVCFIAMEIENSDNDNGKVVGYLVTYHILSELQILDIAVTQSRRGQGIAKKLFAEALSYAKDEDIEIMTLEVRSSNEAALGLYEKLGFDSVGVRKNYYKSPIEDAVLMTLNL